MEHVKNFKYRRAISKLRLSNHPLRIETGRYYKELVEERICLFCDLNHVETEKHFLLDCKLYKEERKNLSRTLSLPENTLTLNLFFSPGHEVAAAVSKCIYIMFCKRKASQPVLPVYFKLRLRHALT